MMPGQQLNSKADLTEANTPEPIYNEEGV